MRELRDCYALKVFFFNRLVTKLDVGCDAGRIQGGLRCHDREDITHRDGKLTRRRGLHRSGPVSETRRHWVAIYLIAIFALRRMARASFQCVRVGLPWRCNP